MKLHGPMKTPRSLSCLTLVASLAALTGACGGKGGVDGPSSSSPDVSDDNGDGDGDASEAKAMLLTPPPEFYSAMAARVLRLAQSKDYEVSGAEATPTLRIIFGGGTVSRGFEPGQSHLICGDAATIAESALPEADRAELVAAAEAALAAAGIDVAVALEGDPDSGGTTVVVGGSYGDLGCDSADKGVTAVAPLDSGNLANGDVGFVFDGADAATVAQTLVQVVSAMVDPKHAAAVATARIPVEDGDLTGIPALSDMGDVLWGVKDTGIDLTLLRAELDQLIPGGSTDIGGIERLIAATVGAVQSTQPAPAGTPPPSVGGPAAQVGAAVGAVDPNTVATVATMAGHPEIAIAVMILGPMIGMGSQTQPAPGTAPSIGTETGIGGTGATTPAVGTTPKVTLPDYATFLDLPKFKDRAAWEGAFLGHVRYINYHYVGDTQESLQALAIMAYAKALQGLGK